jgi:hypothetical protein
MYLGAAYTDMTHVILYYDTVRYYEKYYVLPTSEHYLNFITCDGVTQPLNFKLYVAPYDIASWLAFIFSSILFLPAAVWFLFAFRSQRVVTGLFIENLKLGAHAPFYGTCPLTFYKK